MNTHPDPVHPAMRDGPPAAFPRIVLGLGPTPLHRLTGLMSAFDHGPELLAKREDLYAWVPRNSPRLEHRLMA